MKNNGKVYNEQLQLPVNIFLLFYLYIFIVIVIANLLPVSTFTYFLFLFFGISGICILLFKFSGNILVNEEIFRFSISTPLKLPLLKLKIKEIATAEEVEINSDFYRDHHGKKLKRYHRSYIFKTGKCIKLTMVSRKIYIISCKNCDRIISLINSYKSIDRIK